MDFYPLLDLLTFGELLTVGPTPEDLEAKKRCSNPSIKAGHLTLKDAILNY